MRLKTLSAALLTALIVTACAHGESVRIIDTGCQRFGAITPEDKDIDVISQSLNDMILAHNRAGVAGMCWKSPE